MHSCILNAHAQLETSRINIGRTSFVNSREKFDVYLLYYTVRDENYSSNGEGGNIFS